jgi:hypothetical protein
MSDKLYLMTLNALFPKTLIAEVLDRDLRYESSNGYIYAYIQGIDTLYSESAKQKIEAKIHKLQLTRDLLHSRGIQYIIAVFPSKVDLYSNIYQGVPVENRSVYHLEKALSESGIEYIPLTKDAFNYKPTTGRYLYPPDDAHWNEDADQLIASQIAAKIHELETNP